MKNIFSIHSGICMVVIAATFFLLPASCEKAKESDQEPNEPKADTVFFTIEGVELSNGQVTFLGYNTVKFQGNFSKFQASTYKIVDYGYVVSSTTNKPTISNFEGISHEGLRTESGIFNSTVFNLTPDKTYYARIYLKREIISTGNIEFGYHPFSISFKTKQGSAPIIQNLETKKITDTTFQLNALIDDENLVSILEHGHIWSITNPTPDIHNNEGMTKFGAVQSVNQYHFFSNISNLPSNNNYFARAFVTNQFGTGYSPVVTLNTGKCGAYISSVVWKEFMCHNLGAANTSADPFTPSWEIIGDYWQWGRFAQAADGPSLGNSNSGDINGWITTTAPNGSWLDNQKTINDPCPIGYRVPTKAQWDGVVLNNQPVVIGTWNNNPTNYSSGRFFGASLFLPAAGSRYHIDGELTSRGSGATYWSSTGNSSSVWWLTFYDLNASTDFNDKLVGASIRCIAE